jgi:hypothetical protein
MFSWRHSGGMSSAPSFPRSAPPGSQAGSCSPSFGLRCGVTQRLQSPSGGVHRALARPLAWWRLDFAPSHTLRPGHPTRRAWQSWLSQPCQRVRHQRFPRPGLLPHVRSRVLACTLRAWTPKLECRVDTRAAKTGAILNAEQQWRHVHRPQGSLARHLSHPTNNTAVDTTQR